MDVGEIYSDAIRYPSSDWKKVIILGIVSLLGFLIIPAFLAIGYIFRALKASIAGSDELPEFDEWGEMLVDGLKVFVVQLIYFLIPAVILAIGGTLATPVDLGLILLTNIVAAIIGIILGLIAIIAIANMAYHDSELGAAFRFSEILEIIADIGWIHYIIWYVVLIIVGIVGGFIAGIFTFIPILGPILGYIIATLVIYPYFSLIYSRAVALIYAYE